MKTSTLLILGAGAYILYGKAKQTGLFGQEGWYTEYLASVFQADPEDGGNAVQYPIGQPDSVSHIIDSGNYYRGVADRAGINSDLFLITSWSIEGNQIRYEDSDGGNHLMSFEEFVYVTVANTKQVAAATGDWSHYTGD